MLTGKIICGECGLHYTGMRCKRNGKIYVCYKCNDQTSYLNGKTRKDYCRNNSIQKEKIEQFVIDEIKKVVFNENFIDQVYEQYNLFAQSEMIDNSMIEMLKNKVKDIDNSINNILQTIESGHANDRPIIFNRLKQLEIEKEQTQIKLEKESAGIDYISATKSDVAKIYKKSREVLDGSLNANSLQRNKYGEIKDSIFTSENNYPLPK